jgi:hypothetical protein
MSNVATPTDNPCVERAFITFKSQLLEGPQLRETYKSFYFLQLDVLKRIDFFNKQHLPKKAHGCSLIMRKEELDRLKNLINEKLYFSKLKPGLHYEGPKAQPCVILIMLEWMPGLDS